MGTADTVMSEVTAQADAVLAQWRDTPPVPTTVFHYTSLDAALKILETQKVWCSNFRYSNDPSEAEYGKELLDDVVSRDPHLQLKGIRKAIAELDPYGIAFSADDDSLPQWRAYCANGRGVALGVALETLRKRKKMLLVRVIYEEQEQRKFIQDILDVFRAPLLSAKANTLRLRALAEALAGYLAIVRSAMKSPAYESEKEYRLLDLLPNTLDAPEQGLAFRASGSMIVPYQVADLTESTAVAANEPIREVRIGPCLSSKQLAKSLSLFRDQHTRTFKVSTSKVSMRCDC